MSSAIGLKNLDKYEILEQVSRMPLMGSPVPIVLIYVAYIVFVLKVGPDYMRNRKPFGLKNIVCLLVKHSIYTFTQKQFYNYMSRTGLVHSKCHINDLKYRDEILNHIWLYTMVKISDLLDTIFFVLRKKNNQVTFLHVYHHSLMMVGSWLFLKYVPSETVIFMGGLNALIHLFMYGYYGLAALGPHMAPYLTWKKYLTSMQLVQFVAQIVHYMFTLKYSECPPSKGVSLFMLMNLVVFIALFGNFYKESYSKKQKSELNYNDRAIKN